MRALPDTLRDALAGGDSLRYVLLLPGRLQYGWATGDVLGGPPLRDGLNVPGRIKVEARPLSTSPLSTFTAQIIDDGVAELWATGSLDRARVILYVGTASIDWGSYVAVWRGVISEPTRAVDGSTWSLKCTDVREQMRVPVWAGEDAQNEYFPNVVLIGLQHSFWGFVGCGLDEEDVAQDSNSILNLMEITEAVYNTDFLGKRPKIVPPLLEDNITDGLSWLRSNIIAPCGLYDTLDAEGRLVYRKVEALTQGQLQFELRDEDLLDSFPTVGLTQSVTERSISASESESLLRIGYYEVPEAPYPPHAPRSSIVIAHDAAAGDWRRHTAAGLSSSQWWPHKGGDYKIAATRAGARGVTRYGTPHTELSGLRIGYALALQVEVGDVVSAVLSMAPDLTEGTDYIAGKPMLVSAVTIDHSKGEGIIGLVSFETQDGYHLVDTVHTYSSPGNNLCLVGRTGPKSPFGMSDPDYWIEIEVPSPFVWPFAYVTFLCKVYWYTPVETWAWGIVAEYAPDPKSNYRNWDMKYTVIDASEHREISAGPRTLLGDYFAYVTLWGGRDGISPRTDFQGLNPPIRFMAWCDTDNTDVGRMVVTMMYAHHYAYSPAPDIGGGALFPQIEDARVE